jgi:hypothetical protein
MNVPFVRTEKAVQSTRLSLKRLMKNLCKDLILSSLIIWSFIIFYLYIAFSTNIGRVIVEVKDDAIWHNSPDYKKTKEIHSYHAKGEFVSMELNGKWWFERNKQICWIKRR